MFKLQQLKASEELNILGLISILLNQCVLLYIEVN